MEICAVCERSLEECICCPECGHICSLDTGELFCPVCFPAKNRMHEYFMRLALKEAEEALKEGEVPVGAVLVKENKVIASARNRKEADTDPTAHAELLVLRKGACATGKWRLTDATIYVSKEPCVMCAGAMVNARLGRLVYGCRDHRFGAVESQYHIVSDPRLNHNIEVISGILANNCADILKRFFVKLRNQRDG